MFKLKSEAIMKKISADKKKSRAGSQLSSQQGSAGSAGTPPCQLLVPGNLPPTQQLSTEKFKIGEQPSRTSSIPKLPSAKGSNHLAGKAWAPDMAELELKGRHSSVMGKHVRITFPNPIYKDVLVKRKRDPPPKPKTYVGVLGSSISKVEFKEIEECTEFSGMAGLRCSQSGEIIAHSLLGEVGSFLHEAERRGEFKGLREKQLQLEQPLCLTRQRASPSVLVLPTKPVLHEARALQTWHTEMALRHAQQKKLAGVVGRVEGQLLMARSSDPHNKKQEAQSLLQHLIHPQSPTTAFWRLPDRPGHGQIALTHPRTKQGNPPTPVISGDADSMIRLKGQTECHLNNAWFHSDYLQQREEERNGGVIKVMNKVLFDELEVSGRAICGAQLSIASSVPPSTGDNTGEATPTVTTSGEATPTGLLPGEATLAGFLPGKATLAGLSTHGASDQYKKQDLDLGLFTVSGPALYIDGVTLRWRSSADDNCNHGNIVVKETIMTINGVEGKVARCQVEMINCGSTVLRYCWKVPDTSALSVARPKRQPFYFMADEGMILPGEREELLVLFKSRTPGFYTVTLALSTLPLLERGATVKFTFKGVARAARDYTQQCRDIETYLLTNQGWSICEHEVQRIVELAILKASLGGGNLREEPEVLDLQHQFEQENPNLHFHESVVHRLEVLHDRVGMAVSGCRAVGTTNTYSTVSSSKLRQSLLCLRQGNATKPVSRGLEAAPATNSEVALLEEEGETLMQHFQEDITVLCFRPFLPFCDPAHTRYIVTYTMLTCGLDSVISQAVCLCERLDLTIVEEKEEGQEGGGEIRSSSKKRNSTYNKAKAKPGTASERSKSRSLKHMSPIDGIVPMSTDSPENRAEPMMFSPAHKYRAKHPTSPSLQLYDEKVYIMMYEMLETSLNTVADLFAARDTASSS